MTVARGLLLAAIRGYKRHLSPHKGFACAYRVHLGACSCSTLGLRAISRYGAWRGLGVLRLRLEQCHLVAEERRARPFLARAGQAGFVDCDVPCDGSCIDASSCPDCDACACPSYEFAACVDCGDVDDCGCPSWHWPTRQPVRSRRRRGEPTAWAPGPDVPADRPPARD
jgi:putative component of membrane protein insertase Oxa1/YidC/SpoIIIJ protein YidD